MKKLIPLFLVLMLVLSACGNDDRKSVESFSGETVATISNTRQSEQPATQVPTNGSTPVSTATVTTKATRAQTATPVGPEPTQSHTATRTATRLVSPVVSESPYPIASQETATQTSPAPSKTPTKTNPPKATNTATTTLAATTPSPSKTAAPTATATFSPSPTATKTPMAFIWSGDWYIWHQSTTGKYVQTIMVLTEIGGNVFGNASIDGIAYTFEGTIGENNNVIGEWRTATRTVRFWWEPKDSNQFLGSWAERFGFCGNKLEAVQPEPCMITPPM